MKDTPVATKVADELMKSTLMNEIGSCADTVARKADFIKLFKSYMIAPWLSSSEWQNNIDRMMDEDAFEGIVPPETIDRLKTRVEQTATNVGIMPPGGWTGPIPLSDDGYMVYLDLVLELTQQSIVAGYHLSVSTDPLVVKFNRTSSVGMTSDPNSSNDQFNCTHDVSKKLKLLSEQKGTPYDSWMEHPESVVKIIGYRLQAESGAKADSRPSYSFSEDGGADGDMYEVTVSNSHHGYRVRFVVGVSWVFNYYLMGINALIFHGLVPELKGFWKFTHDDVLDGIEGRFVVATDVSNNDHNFIYEENEYIHRALLDDVMFEWWQAVYAGPTYGAYIDSNDKTRYYKTNSNYKPPLLSGEGLTSITNKVKHTAMQLWNHAKLRGLEHTKDNAVALAKELSEAHGLRNNGDDTLDAFDTLEEAQKFETIATSNPYAVIGLEPASYSGIHFDISNEGRVVKQFSHMTSLFGKGIERERRDFSSALGALPYSSIKGKFDFMDRFPGYDDGVLATAKALYLETLGLDISILDNLDQLALEEVENGTDRDRAIAALMEKLGLKDESKLYYEYSFMELAALDPEATDELFISVPLEKIIWPDYIDLIEQWSSKYNINKDI